MEESPGQNKFSTQTINLRQMLILAVSYVLFVFVLYFLGILFKFEEVAFYITLVVGIPAICLLAALRYSHKTVQELFSEKGLLLILIIIVVIIEALSTLIIINGLQARQTQTQNTNSETADWKTYTNNDAGISFKYPEEWGEPWTALLGTGTEISFDKNSNVGLREGIYYNQIFARTMAFDEIKNSFQTVFPVGNLESTKDITIDKKQGVEFIYSGSNDSGRANIAIFIPVDNANIFQVSFSYKESDGTIDAFNNFISTVKFTK